MLLHLRNYIIVELGASICYHFRMRILDFLREVRVELGKVVWPTREQTIKLTLIVILVTIIVGFFIVSIDWVLTALLKVITKA